MKWQIFRIPTIVSVTQSFAVQQLASSTTRTSRRNTAQRPTTAPSTAPSTRPPRTTCWRTTTPIPARLTTRVRTHTAATQCCQTADSWVWSRTWTSGPSSLVSLGRNMPSSNIPRKATVRGFCLYNTIINFI